MQTRAATATLNAYGRFEAEDVRACVRACVRAMRERAGVRRSASVSEAAATDARGRTDRSRPTMARVPRAIDIVRACVHACEEGAGWCAAQCVGACTTHTETGKRDRNNDGQIEANDGGRIEADDGETETTSEYEPHRRR